MHLRTEPARLAAAHLEDMALAVLLTHSTSELVTLYPDVDRQARSKFRARLKQFSRFEWPANTNEDPKLRRGYTLRQCFRVVAALALVDAHLGPSLAVAVAASNELGIMREILRAIGRGTNPRADDLVGVFATGELWALINAQGYSESDPFRLRWLERNSLEDLWSADADLSMPGQRLIIDVGQSARRAWAWISGRRLMPGDELEALGLEVRGQVTEPSYTRGVERTLRR